MSDLGVVALAKVNALAATVAGMSAGSSYPTVAAFANLPAAASNNGVIYVVQGATGVWFINRHEAGLYRSNGSTWVYLGSDVSTTSLVAGGTTVTADPVTLVNGTNITMTGDAGAGTVTVNSASQVQSDWNASSGLGQILNKPSIPAAQVQSDWNASSGMGQILNKPSIPSAYTDEQAQDATAAMIAAGTQTGITATYDDANNKISFAVQYGTTSSTAAVGNDIRFPTYLPVNNQTASYSLVLTDAAAPLYQGIVTMNVGTANNLTVPQNSSQAFPIGTQIQVIQLGAGQTTIVAGTGATVNNASSMTVRAQYGTVLLTKIATNTWILSGDVT